MTEETNAGEVIANAPSPNGALIPHDDRPAALTPMEMVSRAVETGAGIEVIEKLMELQERWEANQGRKAFDEAMSAARAEMPIIAKKREVDFTTQKGRTNYRYEDLATIAAAVNPILAKHGLSYRFRTSSPPNEPVTVTCIVSHRLGYSEENTLCAGRDESGNKNSIQAIGSTLTYLQRMTLKAALGLAASEDDDGAAAEAEEQITDEQLKKLKAMLDEDGADVAKFCEYMQTDNLADMPQSKFPRALKAIETKRKQKSAPKAAAKPAKEATA